MALPQLTRPALLRNHPNFFFIYAATALLHVTLAAIGIFGKAPNFASPSLQAVNSVAAPWIWGLVSALIATGMVIGLWREDGFTISRASLACGAVLTLARAFFIALPLLLGQTQQGLTALPIWCFAAACHYSQTFEPPVNPATATAP